MDISIAEFKDNINDELKQFYPSIWYERGLALTQLYFNLEEQPFKDFIKAQYDFPYIESGKIGKIYPPHFKNFVENITPNVSTLVFKIAEQSFQLLNNLIGEFRELEYSDDIYSVANVSYLTSESLKNPKNKQYEDFLFLPFAKEINGFDNYGYLFFLSKPNGVSDGKIYYFDTDSGNKIVLVANDFNHLLSHELDSLNDVVNQKSFIVEFLNNHQISFDDDSQYTKFSLEETITTNGLPILNVGECSLRLCNMDLEGNKFYFSNIYNSFSLKFYFAEKCYQLYCSTAYDDNIDDLTYQKMYERYFFYDEKANAIGHYAELKLRLKVILYDTLHKTKDFLAKKDINLLDIMTDGHLQELEKAFTNPVEIDYYED